MDHDSGVLFGVRRLLKSVRYDFKAIKILLRTISIHPHLLSHRLPITLDVNDRVGEGADPLNPAIVVQVYRGHPEPKPLSTMAFAA